MRAERRRDTHECSQLDVLGLCGLQLRNRRLSDAEPIRQLHLGQAARLAERHEILRDIDRCEILLDLRLKRW